MAGVKSENSRAPPHWQDYNTEHQIIKSPNPGQYESSYPPAPLAATQRRRPQDTARSLEIPPLQTRPPLADREGDFRSSPTALSVQSFPSMKRSLPGLSESPYPDNTSDYKTLSPDSRQPGTSQEYRLLCFNRLPDRNLLVDRHGRVQAIEVSAQIHGMFFLSEMMAQSKIGIAQPELTCYRRNLFQISGSVQVPRGPLFLHNHSLIRALEVMITAKESVDNHSVKLIVIPWKSPLQNSPEISPGQEHEPVPIPLLPLDPRNGDGAIDTVAYPIAYRRLQFRIATANNGRRRELQQHFTLHLHITATLDNGVRVDICETRTAPIVVRGRSPRNFESRKQIPLVGSAASRGFGSELQSVAMPNTPGGAVSSDPITVRPGEALRSSFPFDSSHLPESSSVLRHSSYPTWGASHQPSPHSATSSISGYAAAALPAMGTESYMQVQPSKPDLQHGHPTSTTMSGSVPPLGAQYTFHSPTGPQLSSSSMGYQDDNPRPSKSPRHIAPPDSQFLDISSRFNVPHVGQVEAMHPRGYFPASLPTHDLSPRSQGNVYGSSLPSDCQGQGFEYVQGSNYTRENRPSTSGQPNYTWSAS